MRILFVDDEVTVLNGLRAMLSPMKSEWEMTFVPSGPDALTWLQNHPCDVVVADLRMPGMDGAALLGEVRALYPHVVRLVLSGYSDQESILRALGQAHSYLGKPCNAEDIKRAVLKTKALDDYLQDPKLRRVVGKISTLPSMPDLFLKVVEELSGANPSIQRVGELISHDAAMTAMILRLVNSAYFGLRREVSNPTMAVNLLGVTTVTSLILTMHLFQSADPTTLRQADLEGLWNQSLGTGMMARLIAEEEKQPQRIMDDCFTAGLLHVSGALVLGTEFTREYRRVRTLVRDNGLPLAQAERDTFGITNAQVGAYLMRLWGLPNSIVEALAFYLEPVKFPTGGSFPLVAVHAAQGLFHGRGLEVTPEELGLDLEFLRQSGVLERLPVWRMLAENIETGETDSEGGQGTNRPDLAATTASST